MRPVRTILIVVFAAAVAITGCSAHPTASDPAAAAAPAVTRPSAPTPASTPVGSGPRTAQPTTPPTSQPPTGPVACRTSQLHLRTGLSDSGMGRHWTAYVFQNHSALACTMSGFPAVRLLDARGRVMAALPGNDATGPVVRLRPGGSAYFGIGQLLNPDYPGQPCPPAATLVVTPPHQAQALTVATTLAPCGGRLWGAAIQAGAPPAPSPPFPGIWDVRTWEEARKLQDAVENGHQPWRCGPDRLVALYAEQVLQVAEPVIRRVDASTFTVTGPGDGVVATISVTQPFKGKPCGIWVITSVTNSA
jgi:Protein of unknown function (DUF4232)